MEETPERIVYGETIRALEQQLQILEGVRQRAGTLLAAAAVVTALVGAATIKPGDEVTHLTISAIVAFVLVLFMALAIVAGWPWTWALHDGPDLFKLRRTSHSGAALYKLADRHEKKRAHNDKNLGRLFHLFNIASISLVAETLFFLIDIGRDGKAANDFVWLIGLVLCLLGSIGLFAVYALLTISERGAQAAGSKWAVVQRLLPEQKSTLGGYILIVFGFLLQMYGERP